jgi:hypothetical protein
MWTFIEHNFNELHIWCWLRRRGISEPFARKLSKLTAKLTYRPAILIKHTTNYLYGGDK